MIEFNGFKFRHAKQDGVLVVFLSTVPVMYRDFLGKEIDVDGKAYVVYEAYDPYAPPFVGRGHKNRGKFAELRVSPKGEKSPKAHDANLPERHI